MAHRLPFIDAPQAEKLRLYHINLLGLKMEGDSLKFSARGYRCLLKARLQSFQLRRARAQPSTLRSRFCAQSPRMNELGPTQKKFIRHISKGAKKMRWLFSSKVLKFISSLHAYFFRGIISLPKLATRETTIQAVYSLPPPSVQCRSLA